MAEDTYGQLIRLLNEVGARYRPIDHAPEGGTESVSPMRGHDPRQAAKCIVLMVKLGKKTTKYVLAVVSGDRRVDLGVVKALIGATYVSFASTEIAERLAGSSVGTILPFAINPQLELIVNPSLGEVDHLFFNAARLDRSIALRTEDYLAIAKPRMEQIAQESSEAANMNRREIWGGTSHVEEAIWAFENSGQSFGYGTDPEKVVRLLPHQSRSIWALRGLGYTWGRSTISWEHLRPQLGRFSKKSCVRRYRTRTTPSWAFEAPIGISAIGRSRPLRNRTLHSNIARPVISTCSMRLAGADRHVYHT